MVSLSQNGYQYSHVEKHEEYDSSVPWQGWVGELLLYLNFFVAILIDLSGFRRHRTGT